MIDTCGYEKDKKNSHAVVIVGHTKKNWIIKNSWGTEWGDAGFFKVTMRGEANCVDKIKRISYPKVNWIPKITQYYIFFIYHYSLKFNWFNLINILSTNSSTGWGNVYLPNYDPNL